MLLVIAVLYLLVVITLRVMALRLDHDRFSPLSLNSAFYLLQLVPLFWFAISPRGLDEVIFSQVDPQFGRRDLVLFHYLMHLLTFLMLSAGIFLGAYTTGRAAGLFASPRAAAAQQMLFGRSAMPFALFWIGFALFLVMIARLGGFAYLWQNLYKRTELAAGLGYLQQFYTFLLIVSSQAIYLRYARAGRSLAALPFLALAIFALGALGQRGPVALFLFVLMVSHHFRIRRFRMLMNAKTAVIALMLLAFMLVFVQFRSREVTSLSDISISRLATDAEKSVIARFGNIERGVAVLGYFENHDFWGPGLYYSVLTAPVPRSFFPDKPPADTGRYLATIAKGGNADPPQPLRDLLPTSWPDEFLAGYMSFGFPGLVLLALISGYFYGFVYRVMVQRRHDIHSLYLYAYLGFLGARALSPMIVVNVLTIFLFMALLGALGQALRLLSGALPKKRRALP